MKKKNLIIALSLGLVISAITWGSYINISSNEENFDNENSDSSFGFGNALQLADGSKVVTSKDTKNIDPYVGVQVSEENEGKRSIRFFAAISTLDVNASFTRTMYQGISNTITKEKEIYHLTKAYSSLSDGDTVYNPSDYGNNYHYFITYTMNNIPEDHWLDTLKVTVRVGEFYKSINANVMGVILKEQGDNQDLTYTLTSEGHYSVAAATDSIEEAIVMPYAGNFKGGERYVASDYGIVDTVASSGFYRAANTLSRVSLPDTIVSFEKYAFRNCDKIKDFTFPKNLKTIALDGYGTNSLSAVANMTGLKRVRYESIALESANIDILKSAAELESLIIGAEVASIPEGTFVASLNLQEFKYEGSKAQWENVQVGNMNYVFRDNYLVCTDSLKYDITFDPNGGSLTIDDTTYTSSDPYVISEWENKKIQIFSNIPTFDEQHRFEGWYSSNTFEEDTKLQTKEIVVTGNVTYYAKYSEYSSDDGHDYQSAIPLVLEQVYSRTTSADGFKAFYFKYTPQVTDVYYFTDIKTDSYSDNIAYLYELEDDGTLDETTYLTKDDDSAYGNRFSIGYQLEQGKTYIFKAATESIYSYGEMNVALRTIDGDSEDEIQTIQYQQQVDARVGSSNYKRYFTYTHNIDEKDIRMTIECAFSPQVSMVASDETVILSNASVSASTNNKYFDLSGLQKGETYTITFGAVAGRPSSGECTIVLDQIPKGATKNNGIEIQLDQLTDVDWNAGIHESIRNSYSATYTSTFSAVYYSFVPSHDMVVELEVEGLSYSNPIYAYIGNENENSARVGELGSSGTNSSGYQYISPSSGTAGIYLSLKADNYYSFKFMGQSSSSFVHCTYSIQFKVTEITSTSTMEEPHEIEFNDFVSEYYVTTDVMGFTNVYEYFKFIVKGGNVNKMEFFRSVNIELYKVDGDAVTLFDQWTDTDSITKTSEGEDLCLNEGETYIMKVVYTNYNNNLLRFRFSLA